MKNFSLLNGAQKLKFMYKKITKQKNDSWDDISRRIFGTPERSGDFEKLNSGAMGDEVIIFEESKNSESEHIDVALQAGDTEFTDFSEYKLISPLDGVKGAVFIFLPSDDILKLKKGQPVSVFDKEKEFLTGRIANIKAILNENINFIQIEIKSNAGILIESDVPHPLEYGNQSIKDCLTTLVDIFGQTIEFEDDGICDEIFTNEIGTSYAAKKNESVFQFIYRIISSRGLTLIDTGHGLKVFKLDTKQDKISFIEGECIGVKRIEVNFTGDNLARYYEVSSGYPANTSIIITTPVSNPITKRLENDDINANNIEETATRIVCKELGKHFNIYMELSDNFLIDPGEIVIVKYPSVLIQDESEFVIKSVVKIKPDILKIALTLPCVYTGVMPEALPLSY